MKVDEILHTDGSGLWTSEVKAVRVNKIDLHQFSRSFGELRVYFDRSTWDINEHGLIYTDKQFIKELRIFFQELGIPSKGVEYSEQGMQGNDYVSLDVGKHFIESWK